MDHLDSIQIHQRLNERFKQAPQVTWVEILQRDTLHFADTGINNEICIQRTDLIEYKNQITRFGASGISQSLSLQIDTLYVWHDCPDKVCRGTFTCRIEKPGTTSSVHSKVMECPCTSPDEEGILWGGNAGPIGVSSCDHARYRLGKEVGGVVFQPIVFSQGGGLEGQISHGASKLCATNIDKDDWIPVRRDSLEIRQQVAGKLRVLRIALGEMLPMGL
jgi:hypothetical protein